MRQVALYTPIRFLAVLAQPCAWHTWSCLRLLWRNTSIPLVFYSTTVSSIDQAVLAYVLESGGYECHIARERKRQRDRRDALMETLKSCPDAARFHCEQTDSGLHFVLAIEGGPDEHELAYRAQQHGLALAPLSDFAWCDKNREASDGYRRFVIQYSALDPLQAPAAVAALGQVLV